MKKTMIQFLLIILFIKINEIHDHVVMVIIFWYIVEVRVVPADVRIHYPDRGRCLEKVVKNSVPQWYHNGKIKLNMTYCVAFLRRECSDQSSTTRRSRHLVIQHVLFPRSLCVLTFHDRSGKRVVAAFAWRLVGPRTVKA